MTTDLATLYRELSTPHVADACMRLGLPVRCAPSAMALVVPGGHAFGRALPAQHTGSVDVFLEALERAEPGDVLLVDDGGRTDRACVGDLVALEAANAGLSGIVIWGLHRDTPELRAIGLPVLSLGTSPTGPASVEPQPAGALRRARLGELVVSRDDVVLADDDGAIVVAMSSSPTTTAPSSSRSRTRRRSPTPPDASATPSGAKRPRWRMA